MKFPALIILTALALAGCKSEAAVSHDPLAPSFAGYWGGAGRSQNCQRGSIRFDRKQIVKKLGGMSVAMFAIDAAEIRGDVAELTLSAAISTTAMAIAKNKQQLEVAKSFRLHVTLVNYGDHIKVSTVEMDNPITGRVMARGRDFRKVENLFSVRRCPA